MQQGPPHAASLHQVGSVVNRSRLFVTIDSWQAFGVADCSALVSRMRDESNKSSVGFASICYISTELDLKGSS